MKKLAYSLLVLIIFGLSLSVYLLQQQVLELASKQTENYQVKVTEFSKAVSTDSKSEQYISPQTGFREISKKIIQSVVYIEAEVELKTSMPKDKNHNFDNNFLDRFGSKPRSTSIGSGILINNDGFVLTNNHLIEGAIDNIVTVVLNDNRVFTGKVLGTDLSTDVAVVKVDGNDFKGIHLGDSDDVQIGDWVLAVGNPFRLRSTVTAGIVSALSRDVSIIDNRMKIENFIQTDAAINRGNSGGALVDYQGNLIGINTAIATETGSYEGYGFAIPINMASKIARDIIEYGEVRRAYLGVQIQSLTAQRAKQLNMEMISGVEIISTVTDGAAKEAGLEAGDVVLAINNRSVSAHNELQAKIAEFRPGDIIQVSVWKDGKLQTKEVQLKGAENEAIRNWLSESNPAPKNSNNENSTSSEPNMSEDYITETFTEKVRDDLIVKVERSPYKSILTIDFIRENSILLKAGLKEGDVLLAINDRELRTATDVKIHLQHYFSKGKTITIKVLRENKTGYFSFDPTE